MLLWLSCGSEQKENIRVKSLLTSDTLGKATRHKMLVKAECSCGNVRYCRSADSMMVYGGGIDPLSLKFDCSRCKPQVTITLLELHPEHLPKRLVIHKPMTVDGKIIWHTERFRG